MSDQVSLQEYLDARFALLHVTLGQEIERLRAAYEELKAKLDRPYQGEASNRILGTIKFTLTPRKE